MVAVDGSEFWIAACGVGLEPATMIGLRPILSGSEPNRIKNGVLRTSEMAIRMLAVGPPTVRKVCGEMSV